MIRLKPVLVAILIAFALIPIAGWLVLRERDSCGDLSYEVCDVGYMTLGGYPQFVTIKGQDAQKPLLLFVHGGPGDPIGPLLDAYNQALYGEFIVVSWDQRGAGRSYSPRPPGQTMTAEQIISDGAELIRELSERFPDKSLFLAGHSWGSYIGIRLAHDNPENICAYIGIGQVSDQPESERLSYQWALRTARETNNDAALAELEHLGEPVAGFYAEGISGLVTQRKWVREFGGAAHDMDNLAVLWLFAKAVLGYPDYRISDKFNFVEAESWSMDHLEDPMLAFDLQNNVRQLRIPIVFIQGEDDQQTVSALAREYLQQLDAPSKHYVEIPNAAHLVPFEKPKRFQEALLNVVDQFKCGLS